MNLAGPLEAQAARLGERDSDPRRRYTTRRRRHAGGGRPNLTRKPEAREDDRQTSLWTDSVRGRFKLALTGSTGQSHAATVSDWHSESVPDDELASVHDLTVHY